MKAIALFSGGLDSILSARIIIEQGIEVRGVHFNSLFLAAKENGVMLKDHACLAGIVELCHIDITDRMIEIIAAPRYGFGSQINPCIDCRILMLQQCRELMQDYGASFIITGEVLGQRPMSQRRAAFELMDKQSGLQGLVLRPLSALLLDETVPEKQGWVNRAGLYGISGRQRIQQIALTGKLAIKQYPNASGGCLLTDPQFCRRMKDLLNHCEFNRDAAGLLKIGRHFRLSKSTKLIVGRDESENKSLSAAAKPGDYLFFPAENIAGPTCLGKGVFSEDLIHLASSIACRYCDLNGKAAAVILVKRIPEAEECSLAAKPLSQSQLCALRI